MKLVLVDAMVLQLKWQATHRLHLRPLLRSGGIGIELVGDGALLLGLVEDLLLCGLRRDGGIGVGGSVQCALLLELRLASGSHCGAWSSGEMFGTAGGEADGERRVWRKRGKKN